MEYFSYHFALAPHPSPLNFFWLAPGFPINKCIFHNLVLNLTNIHSDTNLTSSSRLDTTRELDVARLESIKYVLAAYVNPALCLFGLFGNTVNVLVLSRRRMKAAMDCTPMERSAHVGMYHGRPTYHFISFGDRESNAFLWSCVDGNHHGMPVVFPQLILRLLKFVSATRHL